MQHTITVPSDLSEITVGQYQEYLLKTENLVGDDIAAMTVSIFCNIDIEAVKYMTASDILSTASHINYLFSLDHELQMRVKLHGVDLGFNPNLDKMSFGEYIDLDENVTDWQKMHVALSVVYRPITMTHGERYSIAPYIGADHVEDGAELSYMDCMKELPMSVALGATVFFYALEKESLETMITYLVKATEEAMNTVLSHSLPSNGDGITAYIRLLKEMLQDSMKQVELQYMKPLPI